MNKAFLREPDDLAPARCPRCDSPGVAVGLETLDAQLPPQHRDLLSDAAFFCPFARCEVVYFDPFERIVTADLLPQCVYPKDPDAPICACFGLTENDIEEDLREGTPRRVRALLERAKGPEARCRTAAPSGECCIADVQRYYLQRRQNS